MLKAIFKRMFKWALYTALSFILLIYLSIVMLLNTANNGDGLHFSNYEIYGLPLNFNVKMDQPRIMVNGKPVLSGPVFDMKWSLLSPMNFYVAMPGKHTFSVDVKSVNLELLLTDANVDVRITHFNKFRATLKAANVLGIQEAQMMGFRSEGKARTISLQYEGSSLPLKGLLKKEYIPDSIIKIYAEDIKMPETFDLPLGGKFDKIHAVARKDTSQDIYYIEDFDFNWQKFEAKGTGKYNPKTKNLELSSYTKHPLYLIKKLSEEGYVRERDLAQMGAMVTYFQNKQKKRNHEPIFLTVNYKDNILTSSNLRVPVIKNVNERYNARTGKIRETQNTFNFKQ